MHTLQPKQIKLNSKELKELLDKYNISVSQLPVVKSTDPAIPKDCVKGDVVKIERKEGDKINLYYRTVV